MRSDTFAINLPSSAPIEHTFDALDLNYVLSGNNIGVAYVFEGAIDTARLKHSLTQILTEYPALAGRADFKTMTVNGAHASVPFTHTRDHPGSAKDYAVLGQNIRNRTDFVPEHSLKDITRGRAPLMAVKLTEFIEGGCILGVTINHGLMDAAGFNTVMHRWSDVFTGRESPPLDGATRFHNFKTDRSIPGVMSAIKAAGIALPLNFNTWRGRVLKRLMFGGLEKIRARDREMIFYTPAQVAALKSAVQKEAGLDWISTHMALGAHVLHAIAPLQLPAKSTSVTIGNVINLRPRLAPTDTHSPDRYVGNALYIMLNDLSAKRPIKALSRADFARHLRTAFDGLNPARIERDMQNTADSLAAGYGYPGLSLFKPIMALNNQSKMNIYGVDFGAGALLRVIPHDVGDHIMIHPAADGGVEVYIRDFKSLKRQKKLLEPEWQERLAVG